MYLDEIFLVGLATRNVDDHARDEFTQIESAIEAVAEGG